MNIIQPEVKKGYGTETEIGKTILQHLHQLKDGTVTIIKQDGYVMQINLCERLDEIPLTEPDEGGEQMSEYSESKLKTTEEEIQKILKHVESIKYGSVTLVIQNQTIVQIEKNEKIKLK